MADKTPQEWQPIATLPQRYQWFIGYGPDGRHCCCWVDGRILFVAFDRRNRDINLVDFYKLTHWMPLPDPPTPEGGE